MKSEKRKARDSNVAVRFSLFRFRFSLLAVLLFAGSASGALEMARSVHQFTRQEITFQVPGFSAAALNPHDPDQIAVHGEFTSPSGKRLIQPAFFWQESDAVLNIVGQPTAWKLRFTPTEPGRYTLRVRVSRRGGAPAEIATGHFESLRGMGPGFIAAEGRQFRFTTGESFFPIGANRCWGDPREMGRYVADMEALSKSGANTLRLWLAPWWLPIETGPGVYDPVASARLDLLMAYAESLGLRVILCIEQHGNFEPPGAEVGLWHAHPYNVLKGGPCRTRGEFFRNAEARRLFRNRLRYLVARWGYSTALMEWELFNEVEWVSFEYGGFYDADLAIENWHVEMAEHLRRIDGHRHLIGTSSIIGLQRRLLARRAIDLVQVHIYEQWDLPRRLTETLPPLAAELTVPVMLGEYGQGPGAMDPRQVTRGIFIAALAGIGAGALPWLQDTPDAESYYGRLTAARAFLGPIRWSEEQFQPAAARSADWNVRLLALQGSRSALLYMWDSDERPGRTVAAQLPDLRGEYDFEAWDPALGTVFHRGALTAGPGGAYLSLPGFPGQAAIKLVRRDE